jgi:hypothetical protein
MIGFNKKALERMFLSRAIRRNQLNQELRETQIRN